MQTGFPITTQTLDNFNDVNPCRNGKAMIEKQRFPKNVALGMVYNRLDQSTRKALTTYQKYLGKKLAPKVGDVLHGVDAPEYYMSSNYVRTGSTIVMKGDGEYFKIYPKESEKMMQHHFPDAYLYLAGKLE